MSKEKEELQRKLAIAQEKYLETEEALARLDKIVAPLNKQIEDIRREQKYLKVRIDKLTTILEKF